MMTIINCIKYKFYTLKNFLQKLFAHIKNIYDDTKKIIQIIDCQMDQEPVTEDFTPSGPYKFTRWC